jgi:RNA polymerase sigma-70 factor (ECF subfamily)
VADGGFQGFACLDTVMEHASSGAPCATGGGRVSSGPRWLWHGGDVVTEEPTDEHPNVRRARFAALARDELVDPLRRFLARRTDPETADDVLSETLLVCWRRFDELPEQALPWAYGVARHVLANAERSSRRQQRVAARVASVDPPREVPDQAGPRDDVVLDALARLGEGDAELLRLWAWEQLGPAEIATVLGVTPNAVSLRLQRARARLGDEIGKIEAGAGHEQSEGGRTG